MDLNSLPIERDSCHRGLLRTTSSNNLGGGLVDGRVLFRDSLQGVSLNGTIQIVPSVTCRSLNTQSLRNPFSRQLEAFPAPPSEATEEVAPGDEDSSEELDVGTEQPELVPKDVAPGEELEDGKGQGLHKEDEDVEGDAVEDHVDGPAVGAQPSRRPPRRTRLSTTASNQSLQGEEDAMLGEEDAMLGEKGRGRSSGSGAAFVVPTKSTPLSSL